MAADLPCPRSTPVDACTAAAVALWEPLAAAAWRHYERLGKGILLIDEDQLQAGGDPAPGFVPSSIIPRGDDFRPLLHAYDPTREILLLVRRVDGEEILLRLESTADTRPAPETCARRADRSGETA